MNHIYNSLPIFKYVMWKKLKVPSKLVKNFIDEEWIFKKIKCIISTQKSIIVCNT